jgi:hypothetical protein
VQAPTSANKKVSGSVRFAHFAEHGAYGTRLWLEKQARESRRSFVDVRARRAGNPETVMGNGAEAVLEDPFGHCPGMPIYAYCLDGI